MRLRFAWPSRAWVLEIFNITLGVLIALGFGELVSAWNAQQAVTAARSALIRDYSKNIGQGIARARAKACIDRRLDTLAAVIDRAGESGRLPPLGDIIAPPIWAWPTSSWDSIGTETRAHFDRNEMIDRSAFAHFTQLAADNSQLEAAAWTRLMPMVGPGRRVSPDEVATLRLAVIEARWRNRAMTSLTRELAKIAAKGGFRYHNETMSYYADRVTPSSPLCRPIGTDVPRGYGLIG